MTQNINDAKQKFEEKLIEGLSAQGNIDGKEIIVNSDILSYILLLNANNNNESIDKSITSETLRFNIFKFIKLSDFNIKEKYDLYKQKYISEDDIQKLKAILTVLKKSEEIYKSLKKFFDSMDNFTTESKSKDSKLVITDKINKINEIKELSITQITSDYFHYVTVSKHLQDSELLVVGNSDVKNFINYLADEYINEIIERIYVGTFKSDVKNLIDEIHKEGGDTQKDLIINKIISDAKIKADVIKEKIDDSDDKNIEILLSNNKSIFSYKLTNEIRNNFNNVKQPIFFNKKTDNTTFFIIFLNKLYRVFIKNNIGKDTVKKNNFISYILYRIYYYYLNIVENIKKIDGKYKSKILDNYDDILGNTVNISADSWVGVNDDSQSSSKITVLETVLNKYNTFFDKLTNNIIELLNSYDKDNSFAVTYPIDTADVNKTQFFFTEFKTHIIDSISSAESEFGEDVSIGRLSDCIYNYYNITFKYELYDSIYIYKDESLYILYKIYEHKYNIYYNKCYENESLLMKRFVISSENLKEIFIEKKTKEYFKVKINILHGAAKALEERQSSPSSRPSSPRSRPSSPLRRKNSSNTKVAHSDMLGDIVDRNLTEVFDTFKSDNSWSDKNLDREKESLLHIVEENLIDIFDTFKSDKAIRDKVDSSLLDIVEINLIDIFDTFNTRTTSEEKDLTTSESSSSEASSLDSTPRNRTTEQESNIIPQIYEKIINNLENDNMYIFAVDNFADYIQVRYKVGYKMEEEAKAKAADMNKNISLRSFNNYIFYIGNDNKLKEKFKINRKYNLKYILKIIYEKYDDIIIVSKPYESNKNILYQYKDSNYINIIFIYEKDIEIRNIENFKKIIDNKNLDKDTPTIQNDNNDYKIIRTYFNDKKKAAADFAESQKYSERYIYAINMNNLALKILNMLEQSNKILIISDVTVKNENTANVIHDNMNVEQDIINGIYKLDKINGKNPEGSSYNKISTKHGINIILTPHFDKEQKKYTIRLILTGFQNDVKATLNIDINDFSKLVLNGKPINMNNLSILNYNTRDYDKRNITISIEDNPSTKTDDSLLDIVEENLSNVFDTLNIKEDKFTVDNPNKEAAITKEIKQAVAQLAASPKIVQIEIQPAPDSPLQLPAPETDEAESSDDDDEAASNVSALNLIQFLINYHDINSNISALNLIKFLINSRDINSNVSALNLIKFLINSRDINIKDNSSTETDDSLLDIVEENLSNVFDTLNIKELKFTNS